MPPHPQDFLLLWTSPTILPPPRVPSASLPPALSSRLPHLLCLLGPKTIGSGTNQDSRIIDFMVFVDRHSTFYSCFMVFLMVFYGFYSFA